MVVANNNIRIRIIIDFRDLPPTTSAGGGMNKRKALRTSTLSVTNGGICLVTCFLVVAIGTGMVTGEVTAM